MKEGLSRRKILQGIAGLGAIGVGLSATEKVEAAVSPLKNPEATADRDQELLSIREEVDRINEELKRANTEHDLEKIKMLTDQLGLQSERLLQLLQK